MMTSLFLHEDDISKTWFYMNFWIFYVLVDEIKRKDEITGFGSIFFREADTFLNQGTGTWDSSYKALKRCQNVPNQQNVLS
jgi:hypothetical protein